jgi:hypothetical protein
MKKTTILVGLLPWLAACASTEQGGMDGAGTGGIGLRWDQGVFIQPIWENGSLSYVVWSDREDDVDLSFSRANCGDAMPYMGCAVGETIVARRLPARSLGRITGPAAVAISRAGGPLAVSADGTQLGLLLPEVLPLHAEAAAVLSNAGINSTSGLGPILGQIETEFLVAPATTFTIGLSFWAGGELTLSSKTPSIGGCSFVDVVGARSDEASIRATDGGYSVVVPATASQESPLRVAVDVRIPASFSGKFVGFDSWMCWEFQSDGQCATGRHLQRGVPLEAPPLN